MASSWLFGFAAVTVVAIFALILSGNLLGGCAVVLAAVAGLLQRLADIGEAPPIHTGDMAARGAPAPGGAGTEVPPPDAPIAYPGAISFGSQDSLSGFGHVDRTRGENEARPYGNPFDTGRTSAPKAAEACADDEANGDEIDGDERITLQASSRNDATRVTAGTMNRRRDLDEYLREEVEEEEDREWWGRGEY
jgi:hypothetical protein